MCKLLNVSRANVYRYHEKERKSDPETERIKRVFRDNRSAYGTRRLKAASAREGIVISRRRIKRIMRQEGLVSCYTVKQYKVHKSTTNEADIKNVLNRQFDHHDALEAIVSDLTYVRVGNHWHYICTLLDCHNREIIGYSCGLHKTAELVMQAFASVKSNLYRIALFHTDRGSEFKNRVLDELLSGFGIKRSLSAKGTPYDNAVAEATFKSIKTEFVQNHLFHTLQELKAQFGAYVWWFNHQRLHSTLAYMTPVEYKQRMSL